MIDEGQETHKLMRLAERVSLVEAVWNYCHYVPEGIISININVVKVVRRLGVQVRIQRLAVMPELWAVLRDRISSASSPAERRFMLARGFSAVGMNVSDIKLQLDLTTHALIFMIPYDCSLGDCKRCSSNTRRQQPRSSKRRPSPHI